MASPGSSTSTTTPIDISRARQQGTAPQDSADSAMLVEPRFRLLNTLQTTLELDAIFSIFHGEIGTLTGSAGLRYINESDNLERTCGQTAAHSCGYRLITQKEHLGEIIFYRDTRFSDSELDVIESLLTSLLCPLRNALLYRKALNASMTDSLTGAGNRLALMQTLTHEISLARRYQQPLSLLVIDIDKFKVINDSHGHSAGDRVLQELVRLIRQVNRSTDQCFRYGGEEFVVLMTNTADIGAMIIAERLRQAVESIRICDENGPVHVTVSIGAASFAEIDDEESLLNRADKAMYSIKRAGGNRTAQR